MNSSVPVGDARPVRYQTLLGIAAAALLGGLAYLLALSWPLLFPPPVFESRAADGCDLLVGACTASFDDTRFIRLSIEPESLQPNKPLQLLVDTAGFRTEEVAVEFSGIDMNMGLIRNKLLDSGGGSFSGNAVLPVCVRQRMAWRAIVTAGGPDGVHRASFDFEVYRR